MIYIFDLLEFEVLAAARGMDACYGFPLTEEESGEQICFAVYQLTKAGILKPEGDQLVIQQPVSGYLGEISAANSVMVIDGGQYRLPRQCIYFSTHGGDGGTAGYVCLENSPADRASVCLSAIGEEEFFRQMNDLNQLPKPHLSEDIGEYDFAEYWESHIPENLWEKLAEGFKTEAGDLIRDERVHTLFSLREKESGQLKCRMALLDFPLEYCMAVQDSHGLVLQRYELDAASQILKKWWRDEL